MSHQLRSELLKLRTTRTLAVLLLAAGAMSLFGVSVEALSRDLQARGGGDTAELFSSV